MRIIKKETDLSKSVINMFRKSFDLFPCLIFWNRRRRIIRYDVNLPAFTYQSYISEWKLFIFYFFHLIRMCIVFKVCLLNKQSEPFTPSKHLSSLFSLNSYLRSKENLIFPEHVALNEAVSFFSLPF